MIKNARTFYIGIFVFLIPFLGLPTSGKTFLTTVSGLALVVLSANITLPKRPILKKLRKSNTSDILNIPEKIKTPKDKIKEKIRRSNKKISLVADTQADASVISNEKDITSEKTGAISSTVLNTDLNTGNIDENNYGV